MHASGHTQVLIVQMWETEVLAFSPIGEGFRARCGRLRFVSKLAQASNKQELKAFTRKHHGFRMPDANGNDENMQQGYGLCI